MKISVKDLLSAGIPNNKLYGREVIQIRQNGIRSTAYRKLVIKRIMDENQFEAKNDWFNTRDYAPIYYRMEELDKLAQNKDKEKREIVDKIHYMKERNIDTYNPTDIAIENVLLKAKKANIVEARNIIKELFDGFLT